MKTKISIVVTIALLSSGCAAVRFYNDSGLTSETGIEFFSPKPYLLVEMSPAKDVAIKTTIFYLPDRGNPHYAKLKPGFGTSDLKLSLENGILTSVGLNSDSKIPESVTALSGIISGVGTSFKSITDGLNVLKVKETEKEQSGDVRGMKDAEKIINAVVTDLEKEIKNDYDFLSKNQKSTLSSICDSLRTISSELNQYRPKDIPLISVKLDNVMTFITDIRTSSEKKEAKEYNAKIDTLKREIENSRNKIMPVIKDEKPSIVIYEILNEKGITLLKQVNF
jgi:hypothetical protein